MYIQCTCQRMTVRFICNILVMCLLRCEMKEIYSNTPDPLTQEYCDMIIVETAV